MFYTYLHCKPNGDPFYVGKGKGVRSNNFKQRSAYHKRIVAKYGRENIQIFVFPCDSEEQAFADEVQQIAQLRREGYELCNATDGGEGTCGQVYSDESRAKMSAARKQRKTTDETKAKMSAAHTGVKMPPRSAESRARYAEKQRGRVYSAEIKAKVSASLLGNNRAKGFKHSEETRAKVSASLLGNRRAAKRRPII